MGFGVRSFGNHRSKFMGFAVRSFWDSPFEVLGIGVRSDWEYARRAHLRKLLALKVDCSQNAGSEVVRKARS